MSYSELAKVVDPAQLIIADKAYVGLSDCNVLTPEKNNHKVYKENKSLYAKLNQELSKLRIKVEHMFAKIKVFRIVNGYYNSREKLGLLLNIICKIINLNTLFKNGWVVA